MNDATNATNNETTAAATDARPSASINEEALATAKAEAAAALEKLRVAYQAVEADKKNSTTSKWYTSKVAKVTAGVVIGAGVVGAAGFAYTKLTGRSMPFFGKVKEAADTAV